MADELQGRCVKCPTCGDMFTIKRGLALAGTAADACPVDNEEEDERRRNDRANTISIRILLEDSLREFPVKDISTTSLGIFHLGWRFDMGRVITFDLIEGYKIILKGVKAKVMRTDDETVGCVIINIEPGVMEPIYHAAVRNAGARLIEDS